MRRRARAGLLGAMLLAAALLVGASLAQRGLGGNGGSSGWGMTGSGYGMMGRGYGAMGGGYGTTGGGYGMMGGGYGGVAPQVLGWDAAQSILGSSADGAVVDPAGNTVTFAGDAVTLDVVAVQPDRPDTTFEIAGLVDPTVRVQRGAVVTVRLINMDYGQDMPHGLVITRLPPPYPYMAMPMMPGGAWGGIPPLVARSNEDLQAARYAGGSMRFRLDAAGTYFYVCQVPGHAQDGMYGRLIVE